MKFQFFRITGFKFLVLSLFAVVFSLSSCVKDELNNLSGNITVQQDFSIPLGGMELFLDAPTGPSIVGPSGSYYYNGLPYPSNFTVFPPIYYAVNFNLNSSGKIDLVKSIELLVQCDNTYPTNATLKIYLIDANGGVMDQLLKDSDASVDAAETDANGDVIKPAQKVFIVDYNNLTILRQTTQLKYKILIFNDILRSSTNPLRLTDKQNFRVTIGARVHLDYNIKDL